MYLQSFLKHAGFVCLNQVLRLFLALIRYLTSTSTYLICWLKKCRSLIHMFPNNFIVLLISAYPI